MTSHPERPRTYQSTLVRRFGPPEVIEVVDLPAPSSIPADTALVAVRSSGVNPVDAIIRSGAFDTDVPYVPGRELAGTVLAVGDGVSSVATGDGVSSVATGDAVVGFPTESSHAELALVPAASLVPKPAAVDWDVAGGIAVVGQTANRLLLAVEPGADDVVVVHGASGGVGTVLVQLLVARGSTVIGTAGDRNRDHLAALGAVPVVYGPGLARRIDAATREPVTASIDLAGTAESGEVGAAVAASGGRAVTLVPGPARAHGINALVRGPARIADDAVGRPRRRVADATGRDDGSRRHRRGTPPYRDETHTREAGAGPPGQPPPALTPRTAGHPRAGRGLGGVLPKRRPRS
ncbi:alcohol dehydrogenase catalytic domain-containing protein [Gordonia aurantiaca]|uniref:alcohol dehydrogenase catalytic domain-containing protein n=1 Tax=Gordonia sp. B21 TaxID=3151852 RepID=UPI003265A293